MSKVQLSLRQCQSIGQCQTSSLQPATRRMASGKHQESYAGKRHGQAPPESHNAYGVFSRRSRRSLERTATSAAQSEGNERTAQAHVQWLLVCQEHHKRKHCRMCTGPNMQQVAIKSVGKPWTTRVHGIRPALVPVPYTSCVFEVFEAPKDTAKALQILLEQH